MDLELKVENFGPIDKATIQVGQFTVFAGPNNTGKTFVAKMLYSILRARNENHARVFFHAMARLIGVNLYHFDQRDHLLSVPEKTLIGRNQKGNLQDRPLSYRRRSQVSRFKMNLISSRKCNPNYWLRLRR